MQLNSNKEVSEEPAPIQKSPTRITIILTCTILVWLLQGYDCLKLSSSVDECFPSMEIILNAFDTPAQHIDVLRYIIFLVLVVSHLRIVFGIEFAFNDESFIKAIHMKEDEKDSTLILLNVLLSLLAGITILISFFVNSNFLTALSVLLFIEGILIIVFDIRFCKVLFIYDQDRLSNYIILFNDILFFIIGYLFILSLTLPIPYNFEITYTVCVIYISITCIETYVNYRESLKKAFKNTFDDIAKGLKALLRHTHNKT